jgi:hypothetical protein
VSEVRRFRRPALFELLGFAAIVLGFINLVLTFRRIHYLPAPFVFDVTDTFMDWYNTAYWAHNYGAYSVWRTVYLPLSFVITGHLSDPRCYAYLMKDIRACDPFGIVVILAMYLGSCIVSAIAFWKRDPMTAPYRSTAVALGAPLLFGLERGQLIMLAYIGFVLVYGNLLKSRGMIAAVSGFLFNMKVYLLFPVLAFAIKRQWRLFELCLIAAVGIYLISLFLVGAGTPFEIVSNLQNWFSVRLGTPWDELLFSTTYKPFLAFDELQFPIRDYASAQVIDIANVVIAYEVVISRAVAFACIAGAWLYPRAVTLNRMVFFILMQSFVVQNPGGYAITLIVFLVFMDEKLNRANAICVFCAYLISISTDYNIAEIFRYTTNSWLGGREVESIYAMPLGSFVRPLLILIILWVFAFDTFKDIYRAAKLAPPIHGLTLARTIPPARSPEPSHV